MRQHKIYDLTLILFFFILFSAPAVCVIRYLAQSKDSSQQELSIIEGKRLASISSPAGGYGNEIKDTGTKKPQKTLANRIQGYAAHLLDRSWQKEIEQMVSDRFPLRLRAIQLSKAVDRVLIKLAYGALRDPVIPADMDSYSFVALEKSLIISGPEKFDATTQKLIDDRIKNYDRLLNEYPKIHFYLYCLERLEDSQYHPLNKYYNNADRGQAIAYFEKNKPRGLTFQKMALSSFEDHAKYYFGTDHHWNINGALLAYDDIYEMLANNYPEISPPLKHDDIVNFPDIKFFGSLARSTLYPIQPDTFEVVRLMLPPYRIVVNGEESAYNKSAEYMEGKYSTIPYVNHYGVYYGEQRALIEYVFVNQSNRSLLIISDSYSRPLQPMLASHYEHTYVVDFRKYEGFSLAAFLSKYPVDDILILGSKTMGITSPDWMIDQNE